MALHLTSSAAGLCAPSPSHPPTTLAKAPLEVAFALPVKHHGHSAGRPVVSSGQRVAVGALLANLDDADLHSSIAGIVEVVEHRIIVRGQIGALWSPSAIAGLVPPASTDTPAFGAFLAAAGAVGMGGSLFPTARKLRASTPVSTLVLNGTECEPGIGIDRALLLHHADWIRRGADALARACGATRIVLVVQAGARELPPLRERYPYEIAAMPQGYPAGAEKLIVQRLTKRPLPTGRFPFHAGFLVQNVATVRGIGRALRDGVPFVERPLSLIVPEQHVALNLIVPTGMSFADLLTEAGVVFDSDRHVLVAGGLMMGRRVVPEDRVTLGTSGLFVLPAAMLRFRERTCLRCGACHDACPLRLHPIDMVQRAADGRPRSRALQAQLQACFLCGACSAVCPADIPLVQRLREARQHV